MTGVMKRMMSQSAAALTAIATLAGCDSIDSAFDAGPTRGVAIADGFFGSVAGDDPRAVLTARSTLARGGTAADAAVAYFFMAAVSYPSTSSLAAGGVCMNYDEGDNQAQLLDFRNAPVPSANAFVTRPTSVPGAVRGMFALHARSGALLWQDLISPAERAARFGIPVSRALSRDLQLVGDALLVDEAARQIFGSPQGGVLPEGANLVQLDLGGMLSLIRTRGAGDFYVGVGARQFSEAVASIGVPLTFDDLRNYAPHWSDTYQTTVSQKIYGAEATVHVPGSGFDSGASFLASFEMLRDHGDLVVARETGVADHLIAEVALRTAVARTMNPGLVPDSALISTLLTSYSPNRATPLFELPAPPSILLESPATSSIVAVDAYGNAVSCVFTMNNLFGNGLVAPGTGVLLAAAPGENRGDGLSLLPMIAVNETSREVLFAGAVSGGIVSGPIMASVVAEVVETSASLEQAVERPRVFHPGDPDVVVVEPTVGEGVVAELVARGHEVRVAPELGRVNAILCPDGLRNGGESCVVSTDPRAFGLAAGG
jgi:gamma-glutamyltranspeptidase/glutathione hydrolase